MAARIRKGDTVEVLSGKFKGTRGSVLSVDGAGARVVVERVNVVKRHQKPTSEHRQGGIIEKEAPIQLSKVMLVHKGDRTRVGFREQDGKRVRWSVRHNEAIDG